MDKEKRKRLEAAGWSVGTVTDFLQLSPESAEFVEVKLSLSKLLKQSRLSHHLSQSALAQQINSSQSRVAKMEAGDPSTSVDHLIRTLFSIGATRQEVAEAIIGFSPEMGDELSEPTPDFYIERSTTFETIKTLFLAWQDPISRSWFPVGRLTFDGVNYQFIYTCGVQEAQKKCGFQPLQSFPYLDKAYTSTELFPVFSNRLLSRSRPDYVDFVQWLNIPQRKDDPIAMLARSGGRQATDTLAVLPCPEPDENGLYHIHFFSHGLSHLPTCAIERINHFRSGELLLLAHEFQNRHDPSALTLHTEDHYIVGYCPRYLLGDAFEILRRNPDLVHVHVERVNQPPTPLQFRLLCNMTALGLPTFAHLPDRSTSPLVLMLQPPA